MSRVYTDEAAAEDLQWIQEKAQDTTALQGMIYNLRSIIGIAEMGICGCGCCNADEECYEDITAAQNNVTLCKKLIAQVVA